MPHNIVMQHLPEILRPSEDFMQFFIADISENPVFYPKYT